MVKNNLQKIANDYVKKEVEKLRSCSGSIDGKHQFIFKVGFDDYVCQCCNKSMYYLTRS